MKTNLAPKSAATPWTTPVLAFRGTVGQILQNGNGKLSISGSDPGEGRCEKPHAEECARISSGGGS